MIDNVRRVEKYRRRRMKSFVKRWKLWKSIQGSFAPK